MFLKKLKMKVREKKSILETSILQEEKNIEKSLPSPLPLRKKWGEIFESLKEGIVCLDAKGFILDLNRIAAEYFRGRRGDFRGRNLQEIFSPQGGEKKDFHHNLSLALQGKIKSFEAKVQRKKGNVFYLELSFGEIKEENGEKEFIVFLRDLTEVRKKEEELKNSEERLNILFEYAPDAYFLTDLKGNFIAVNRRVEELSGYKKEELIGKNFLKLGLLTRNQIPKALKCMRANARGMPCVPNEYLFRRKDGSQLIVEISSYPVKISGKKVVLGIARDITERKKREKALEESEQKYRTIIENTKEGIFIFRGNRLLYVNDVICRKSGYSRDELLEINLWKLVHPEERTRLMKMAEKISRERKFTLAIEGPFLRKDGEIIHCALTLSPIVYQNRFALLGIIRDVSLHVRAQKKIEEARDYAEKILDSIPLPLAVIDEKLRLVSANYSFSQTFALIPEKMVGNEFLEQSKVRFMNEHSKKLLERLIKEEKSFKDLEISFDFPEKERRVFLVGGREFHQEKESRRFFILIFEDITEKKKDMEERLLLEETIRQAEEMIMVTGTDSSIKYVNPSIAKITGFSAEEVKGKKLNFIFRDERQFPLNDVQKLLNQGKMWSGSIDAEKKGGGDYFVDMVASPVKDQEGNILNHIYVIRDVTREKEIENKLHQAQKMEALGVLAGGVAHDFNNILTSIVGYAELALDDAPRGSLQESNLKEVLRASQRGKELVNQILLFSRRRKPEKKVIQISSLLKEALKFLRATIPSNIEMRQSIKTEASVEADPIQVYQVLMNLCANAAEAMNQKGGILEVSLEEVKLEKEALEGREEANPGTYLKLSVRDTGTGIPDSILPRIFDPFFTTKDTGRGTGMGLSMVDGIVKNHGGIIKVETEVGKGSTFHVFFPKTSEVARIDEEEVELNKGDGRILFIEDERQVLDSGIKTLEHLGYQVEGFSDPVEALEAFKKSPERFNAVITDMTMPRMMGDKLAKKILQIRPEVPVIITTGYNENIDEEKAGEIGVFALIMKPFLRKEIASVLERALNSRKNLGEKN